MADGGRVVTRTPPGKGKQERPGRTVALPQVGAMENTPVKAEGWKKQEQVSHLVLLEYTVQLGKLKRSKIVQELRLVTDSLRQHAKGRDFILEMMRNHFKFLGRKDKMAAARTRPGEERDGQQGASLLGYSWNLGPGRAVRTNREEKR